MTKNDRRSHIRIQDQILLHYRRVNKGDYEKAVESYREGTASPWTPSAHPHFLVSLHGVIKKLREKDEVLADVIELLDQKLTLILNLIDGKRETECPARPHLVDLSATGLAFVDSDAISVGDFLEMEIGLLPSHSFFHCYGEVVRSEPDTKDKSQRRIAVRFIWITESDQERLIEHIFQRQVLQLRLRRQQLEEEDS